ncbi:MAG: NADH-quinone oxidoreductase subunit F, partial [Armatimonadetes bacterium]|nr:NADH-quinone oxidoreductase subunit F [Armatimonadota bacterium]
MDHGTEAPPPTGAFSAADLPHLLNGTDAGNGRYRETLSRLRREELDRPAIFVGAGTCGLGAGAAATLRTVRDYLAEHHLAADVVEVGCIGMCVSEPMVDVQLPGRTRLCFAGITGDKVGDLLDAALAGSVPETGVLGQHRAEGLTSWEGVPHLDEHPFLAPQKRWVLANCGLIDPSSIDEYLARGGYRALFRALTQLGPGEVCDIVAQSGLRGRGGAGFPTGTKWQFALKEEADRKYVICNADEGDPGAFMDRAVIEGDPHRLLEGLALAAYAIGASKAYIYIRAEYPLAIERLQEAIGQAKALGLIGERILESDFSLEIVIKQGAGAFVCGEETALIHSVEGRRGMPRPRPPFPAQEGLFGKPTVINNVETLANVAAIVAHGAEWFSAVGTEKSKGTKVFALAGKVARTGLVEVPMGTKIRDIV